MEKTITLMDYAGKKTEFSIPNFEDVLTIVIQIVTGDEIAMVIYDDGTIDEFDSSGDRLNNYFDGEYTVYNKVKGINFLDDPKFLEREDSYFNPWRM